MGSKIIDNLTIGEAKEIAVMFTNSNLSVTNEIGETVNHGLCIAVLDKGFVYVGMVSTNDKFMRIEKAKCVRRWGTTNGLGELALKGVQSATKLDETGTVISLIGEMKHLIVCEADQWLKY